jgi:hypothetical protein
MPNDKKPDKEIIEKIKKLLALAQSSNENEAQLAAQHAQSLMIKYNVDETKLNLGSTISKLFRSSTEKYLRVWEVSLLTTLARYNFCYAVSGPGDSLQRFVTDIDPDTMENEAPENAKCAVVFGREMNIVALGCMFNYLSGACERLSMQAIKDNRVEGRAEKRRYKNSYIVGFIHSLQTKLKDAATKGQADWLASGSNKNYLTVTDQSNKENKELANSLGLRSKLTGGPSVTNGSALESGMRDGQAVGLNKQFAPIMIGDK